MATLFHKNLKKTNMVIMVKRKIFENYSRLHKLTDLMKNKVENNITSARLIIISLIILKKKNWKRTAKIPFYLISISIYIYMYWIVRPLWSKLFYEGF